MEKFHVCGLWENKTNNSHFSQTLNTESVESKLLTKDSVFFYLYCFAKWVEWYYHFIEAVISTHYTLLMITMWPFASLWVCQCYFSGTLYQGHDSFLYGPPQESSFIGFLHLLSVFISLIIGQETLLWCCYSAVVCIFKYLCSFFSMKLVSS